MKNINFKIKTDGTLNFIYNDNLADLMQLGETSVKRASHVEPEVNGTWSADMEPVGGPKLIGFKLRQEALDAEVEWLNNNILN